MSTPACVVHVPHASRLIPDDVVSSFALGGEELAVEVLAMTDHYTDELFDLPPSVAHLVVFPVSRLVVDPERFRDDADEAMAARGMGVVYTSTSRGEALRQPPSDEERRALLERFYDPHHAALTQAVRAALDEHDVCLVLDEHSFPEAPLPYEVDQRPARPQICVGTDGFHTPPTLRDRAVELFRTAGFTVEVDRPFAGALVPGPFCARDARVHALMVEVNRGLYLDAATGDRLPHFGAVCSAVQQVLRELIADQPS